MHDEMPCKMRKMHQKLENDNVVEKLVETNEAGNS
jgi:hypothetical protein